MGTAKPSRHHRASTSPYIGDDHSAGRGDWLFCQLDKKSYFSNSITAWIFLAAAVVFLLGSVGLIHIEPRFTWPFVAIGTAFSFILEWQFASRPAR
jgi:hypothetical protein